MKILGIDWKRDLEPPMAAERAEAILAPIRPKFPSLTDLQIASKKERNRAALIWSIGLGATLLIHFRHFPDIILIPVFLLAFAAMIYFGIQRSRFTRIRKRLEQSNPSTLPTDHRSPITRHPFP
ncbi:MAG: hypothetical protein QM680_01375 [Luteolibacter sp.]